MKRKTVMQLMLAVVLTVMCVLPAFASQGDPMSPGVISVGVGLLALGLVVNQQVLEGMRKNFFTIFNEARSAYQSQWQNGAMDIPSTTSLNTYAWLEDFPKMREWIGERYFKALKSQAYSIINKTFESSVRVPREAIEDDQYAIYSIRFRAMGAAAEALWDDLFFDVLNSSFTGKSYDGKTFFATDHPSGSNKLSGGTSALSTTSYEAALALLRGQKDSKGDPLFNGSERVKLWVPPALEGTGRRILNADLIAVSGGGSESNVWKGSAELVVAPKIKVATNWFLTVEFMGLKPFIVQQRRLPDFVAQENPADPSVFNRNEFEYGTSARGNSGYGLHQLAVGSVGA